jgi:hypothetical protein
LRDNGNLDVLALPFVLNTIWTTEISCRDWSCGEIIKTRNAIESEMSISLFLAPLLFQHDLMVLFPHILHVCLHLNQSDPETQPAYAAERSSFANCIQCSSNFLCSSFTNSLYGCTCKLSRSPNAQLRGLDWIFFLPGLLQALNKLVLLLAYL